LWRSYFKEENEVVSQGFKEEDSYFVLLDALDEAEDRHYLFNFLKKVEKNELFPNIKIIVTSRPEKDIMSELKESSIKSEHIDRFDEMNKRDIQLFASDIVERYSSKLEKEEIKQGIEDILVEKSNGIFLWMRFADRWFRDHSNPITLEDIKKNLSKGLEGMYSDFFTRLFSNLKIEKRKQILEVIKVILCSFEPLTVTQISWLLGKYSTILEIQSSLESIESIFPSDSQGYYYSIHKTIADFIQERTKYFYDKFELQDEFQNNEIHRRIANTLITQLFVDSKPSFYLPKVRDLFYDINVIQAFPKGEEFSWIEKWTPFSPK
jgi:hypothetical protein